MSYNLTLKSLGGVVGPPGTPNLVTAAAPGTSGIFETPRVQDQALVSEEKIGYSLPVLPTKSSDLGPRPEELIQNGELVFGARSGVDERTAVFTIYHLNILFADAWNRYKILMNKKIKDIVTQIQKNGFGENIDDFLKGDENYKILAEKTLNELDSQLNPSSKNSKNYHATISKGTRSQLSLFLNTAGTDKLTAEKKRDLCLPNTENLSDSLSLGFQKLVKTNSVSSTIEEMKLLNNIITKSTKMAIFSNLISSIHKSFPDIMQFLNVDSIVNTFSLLGVTTSAQEDGGAQRVIERGKSQQLYICTRGPVEIYNYWDPSCINDNKLYLIITRSRDEHGCYGHFIIRPHWSVVDDSSRRYTESTDTGPLMTCDPSRSNIVPQKEFVYRGLSGKDEIGHIMNIGTTRYGHSETIPETTRKMALGIPSAKTNISVRACAEQTEKLPKITIYINT
jgi:hypothetical protein